MKWVLFVAVLLVGLSGVFASLETGLVAYYNFDEASGNLIDDVTGTHNGVLTGTITQNVDTPLGKAYTFSDGYISIPSIASVFGNTNSAFSLSVWINSTSSANYQRMIIARLSDVSQTGWSAQFRTEVGGNLTSWISTTDTKTYSSFVRNTNTWNHMVFVVNNAGTYVYRNGVLDRSSSLNIASIGITPTLFYVGKDQYSGENFGGQITKLGIWSNVTLNSTQVNELYNSGLGLEYPFGGLQNFTIQSQTYSGLQLTNYTANVSNSTYSELFATTNGTIYTNLNWSGNVVDVHIESIDSQTRFINTSFLSQSPNSTLTFDYGILNITGVPFGQSSLISGLQVNLTQLGQNLSNTQSGTSDQYYIGAGTWQYVITAANYTPVTGSVVLANGLNQLQVTMFPENSLILNFFDEQTLQPLTSAYFTITSQQQDGYGFNMSLSNTTSGFNLTNLPYATLEIRYGKEGYDDRSYFLTVPITSSINSNLSLYLLNQTVSERFILTVTDTSNRPIEDTYIQLLRRYVLNNQTTYRVVEMMQPSVALGGVTSFVGVPNTVPYIFRVLDESGAIIYQSSATSGPGISNLLLVDSQLYLRIPITNRLLFNYQQAEGISFSLTNTSNAFWLNYNDPGMVASSYCLYLFTNNNAQSQCSTASAGVLSIAYTFANNTQYYAYFEAQINDQSIVLGTPVTIQTSSIAGQQTWGNMGWFFVLIVTMFCAIIFTVDVRIGIFFIPLVLLVFGTTVLGLVTLSYTLSFVLILASIIILFVVGGKDK